MLHTNYQCHRLIGSGEDLKVFFYYIGHEGHACHVTSAL